MISVNFLSPKNVEGMEFIDFQNKAFANDLSDLIQTNLEGEGEDAVLSVDVEAGLYKIIEKYTGFSNVKLDLNQWGNLAVDTGYFNPSHILNIKNIETLLRPEDSSLYKWFAQNSGKIFKGTVNLQTGKVEGGFKYIPVTLYVNEAVGKVFPQKYITKFGIPLHRMIAGAIAHELGHIFGGCALIAEVAKDNFVVKAALEAYKETQRPELRVQILKDATKLLDLEKVKDAELAETVKGDEEFVSLFFNKMIRRRNSNRALSLGVTDMTSEVLADAYAIRMGFDKEILACVYTFYREGIIGRFQSTVFLSIVISLMNLGYMPVYAGLGVGFLLMLSFSLVVIGVCMYFGFGDSDIYNSPQRRFEDGVREMIAKYKQDTNIPASKKAEDLAFIDEMLALNKKMKPFFEGTAIKRIVGWVMNGADYKAKELEHYTQALNNHEINLLSGKLSTLATR